MAVERYSHVMHLVSSVKAEMDESRDVFDVIRAVFPAGTLSGAPKIRAMEIISELEGRRRDFYGGMVFNLGFNGNFDSCITIRTILKRTDGVLSAPASSPIRYPRTNSGRRNTRPRPCLPRSNGPGPRETT